MKKFLLLMLMLPSLLMASVSTSIPKWVKKKKPILCRITFYHRYQDCWGAKTASGVKAQEGITVAAHSDFEFGTQVYIPELKDIFGGDGLFEVQDRGRDVERKKAAKGKAYVFDIYVDAKSKLAANKRLQELMRNVDDYLPVYVY